MIQLPIDAFVDRIAAAVRRRRALVVTAAPGAGKTTRVPPALAADGPVLLLQPRRSAARSIARRIAAERGWTLGRDVGWQVRFDRHFSAETRLLVVTEGILTARLQSDPLLSDFRTIVLDEFHERSIHADLGIALARQAWRARNDLRIVVMSATLDAAAVAAFLDGCPVVEVPGRVHPVNISYAPGQTVAEAVRDLLTETRGNVLCFLPGAADIRRAVDEMKGGPVEVVPLHGSLPAEEQDIALAPPDRRRVIVATNIAETSVTVPGVTAVVDTGLHKVARYDADRGIDSLETERITFDAADQRAGRAGRVAPGVVRRLWDARDRLRPHREPEIHRIDLSATALDVFAWGGDPRRLEWFDPPSDAALDAAISLLERLELVSAGRLTATGDRVRRLPLHPRLARMLVASGGAQDVVRACALLSERHVLPPRTATTSSDLLSALDAWRDLPAHVHHAAASLQSEIRNLKSEISTSEVDFRRAILSGYPDRVAMRREPQSPAFLLATGTGATLSRDSGVRNAGLIVAIDVHATPSGSTIRIASAVEREWLEPTTTDIVHRFDVESGRVKAARVDRYDALTLGEHPVAPDPDVAAQLLAAAWLDRGARDDEAKLLRRLAFAGRHVDVAELVKAAAAGARSLDDIRLAGSLPPDVTRALEREAPETLRMPRGRPVPLEYHDDGSVSLSVKLQELFGVEDTPRIGARRVPVRIALLAPNGRPVQITQDLKSFWERTYPEVRKELRGRYPKHKWPENPQASSLPNKG